MNGVSGDSQVTVFSKTGSLRNSSLLPRKTSIKQLLFDFNNGHELYIDSKLDGEDTLENQEIIDIITLHDQPTIEVYLKELAITCSKDNNFLTLDGEKQITDKLQLIREGHRVIWQQTIVFAQVTSCRDIENQDLYTIICKSGNYFANNILVCS